MLSRSPAWTFVSIFFTLCAIASNASAAPHLRLRQAIALALKTNPAIKESRAKQRQLHALARHAMAPQNPKFTFGLGDLAATSTAESQNKVKTYEISQTLGFPGKASARSSFFDHQAQAHFFEMRMRQVQTVFDVKEAFYELWLARKRLDLNDLRQSSFKKILRIAKRRAVKNTSTEVQYLSVKVTLDKILNERVELVAEENAARARLNLLIGRRANAPLAIDPPPFRIENFHVDRKSIRRSVLRDNPKLRSIRQSVKAADAGVSSARRAVWPNFTLSAGRNNFNNYAFSVQLSVPLWYFWNQRPAIDAARENLIATRNSATNERRRVLSELQMRIDALSALAEKLKRYQTSEMPLSKKAFDAALRNYRFGTIAFADLSSATEDFIGSQNRYSQLRVDFALQKAGLSVLTGRLPKDMAYR